MPATTSHHPASNRAKGSEFEQAALTHLETLGLLRPSDLSAARTEWAEELDRVLRPVGGTGVFEVNTVAEGLWVDPTGNPVWVECSGVFHGSGRPGFLRSDTTRKIAGTISCLITVCHEHNLEPPSIVLLTSHLPDRTSAAAAYLIWGVIRPVGTAKCQIVELEPSGQHRVIPVDRYSRAG